MNINGTEITPDQLRYLLYRQFWKGTVDANLNTVEGCEQAATAAVSLLEMFGEDWCLNGTMPPWIPRNGREDD